MTTFPLGQQFEMLIDLGWMLLNLCWWGCYWLGVFVLER